MKRSLACILILALLLTAIPLGSLASSATTTQYGTVHGGWLRLRQQPSFSARTLTSYYTGTQLTIQGYTNGWYQVVGPDGNQGYCYAYYITLGGVTPTPSGGYDAWVTSANGKSVRLRSGPSTSYGVIGSYPVGTQVSVLTHGTYWDYIQIGAVRGHMMSQFLTSGSPVPTPGGSYAARVTSRNGYGVRLRTGPGKGYSAVGVYSVGTNVVVLNHGATWDYIRIGTRTGYMMNEFLTTYGVVNTVTAVTLTTNTPLVGEPVYPADITPAGATVTYRWYLVRNGVETDTGVTGVTYTPNAADVGAKLKIVATGTGYFTGAASVVSANEIMQKQAITAVTLNNMSPAVGDVLSAVTTPATSRVNYAWYVGGIWRTSNPTYTVTSADVGGKIKVTVTGKEGYTGTQTSLESAAVTATGTVTGVTIDNTAPREGDTLTASPVPVTADVTYRWLDNAGNELGTGATYAVTAKNATDGITIRAEATGKGNYAGSKATSAPTATVVAAIPLTSLTLKPAQPYLGDTIEVDAVAPSSATSANLTDYHWFVNNVEVTAAAGKTSFVLDQASYENAVIKLTLTGTSGYKGTVSGVTASVLKARTLTGTPTITGDAKVKATLTANRNDIPAAANVTYEWFRDGVTTGSTGATYIAQVTDFGKTLTVKATAGANSGYTGTVTSAGTVISTPADMSGAPAVIGTPTAGQTLTAGRGTLPSDLTDANINYYWIRNTTPISTTPSATYQLTTADVGANISVVATGKTGSGYNDDPTAGVQSPSVGPVAAATTAITLSGTPSITPASATVGTKLTAGFGTVNVPTGFNDCEWAWYAGSSTTAVSTSYEYTPVSTDTLTLRLTATGGGYTGSVELTGITVTQAAPPPATTYDVTLTPGTGYTLTPSGSSSPVTSGGSYSFTVDIANGYQKGTGFKVKANGGDLTEGSGGVYTIQNITAAQTVTVEGVELIPPTTYAVTLTPGTGYTLAPNGTSASPVTSGGSYSFTVSISAGYKKGAGFKVKANGGDLTENGGVYTIQNITAAQTVTVEGVEPETYGITYNGMDSATAGTDHPSTHTYGIATHVSDPTKVGFTFAGWTINGGTPATTDLTLGATDYTAAITLTATWTQNP